MTDFLLKSDIDEIVQRMGPQAAALSGKTVLLTGGRGFLGRYFTEIFAAMNADVLDEPARIVILDNLITAGKAGSAEFSHPNVEFGEHDVTKPFAWDVNLA